MTSTAGGRGFRNADGCKNCFKSSAPITMRETPIIKNSFLQDNLYYMVMIAHKIYLATFSFKLDKIHI